MTGVRSLSEIVEAQATAAERIALAVRPVAGLLLFGMFLLAVPAGPMVRILALCVFLGQGLYSLAMLLLARQEWPLASFSRMSIGVDSVCVLAFYLICLGLPAFPQLLVLLLGIWAFSLSVIFLSLMRFSTRDTLLSGVLLGSASAVFASAAVIRYPGTPAAYLFIVPVVALLTALLATVICASFLKTVSENLVTEDLLKASRRLRMTLDIVTASVPNLHRQITTLVEAAAIVSDGARNQSAGIEQVMAGAEKLQKAMGNISLSTQKTADTVARTAQFSESGNAIVKRVIEEILGIHEVVEKMVSALARINDIADQTNLLALNAAIEASRTGDEHSGFSVVADEIRTLAEKSSEAASEVSRWVRQVENVIFSGGESSKEAGKIFDTIRRDLGAYASFVQELALSVKEQLTANQEVTGSIVSIGTVVDRNSDAAGIVSRIISDLKAEMVKLDALVGDRESRSLSGAAAGRERITGDAVPLDWREKPAPGGQASGGNGGEA